MNKTHRKHRYYEKPMPKIKMAAAVIAYYIQSHIRGICTFGGFGLVALGLIILHADIPTALMLIVVGACMIVLRMSIGDKNR